MIYRHLVDNHLVILISQEGKPTLFIADTEMQVKNIPSGKQIEGLVYVDRELELPYVKVKKLVFCKTRIGSYLCNVIGEIKENSTDKMPDKIEEFYHDVINELSKFI